jgi:hypothetical protein
MAAIQKPRGVAWKLQLVGEKEELRGLAKMFPAVRANGGLHVWLEDKNWYLHAPEFETMTTARAIVARGETLVGRLNGLGFLKFGVFRPVATGNVMQAAAQGGNNHFLMVEPAIHYVPSVALLTYLGDSIPPLLVEMVGPDGLNPPAPPEVESWHVPGQFTAAVDEALSLLSVAVRSEDWRLLYFIYEIVEGHIAPPQPSRVAKVLGGSTEEIRRFSGTANSKSHLGTRARHGRQTRDAPKNPMTFHEARTFMRGLLLAWVQHLSK